MVDHFSNSHFNALNFKVLHVSGFKELQITIKTFSPQRRYILRLLKITYVTSWIQSLPSATKLRRLCFNTCQSFCSQGGLPQWMLGYHPLGVVIPREQTPPPPEQAPSTREQTPPRAGTPWIRHPPGPGTPLQTATVADGTHPTGMHSCCNNIFLQQVKI